MFANTEAAREVLDLMIDAGHRYRNIENNLGLGAAFAFGKDIAETALTKLLPKGGNRFEAVMRQLRLTKVGEMARTHADLRVRLVDWYLDHRDAICSGGVPEEVQSMPTGPGAEQQMMQQIYVSDSSSQSNDTILSFQLDPALEENWDELVHEGLWGNICLA